LRKPMAQWRSSRREAARLHALRKQRAIESFDALGDGLQLAGQALKKLLYKVLRVCSFAVVQVLESS